MKWTLPETSQEELSEFKERYTRRMDLCREYGHDHEEAIRFVIDFAGDLTEPILDIGTGKGFAAIEMARRGVRVVGVDNSKAALRGAALNARASNVEALMDFYLVDAGDLPFENGHFQLATMINVLHHLEDFKDILREVSRVLVPGGRLLLAEFTTEGFDVLDRIHDGEERAHPHRYGHGVDDVAEKLAEFGLRCVGRDIRFNEYVMIAEKV